MRSNLALALVGSLLVGAAGASAVSAQDAPSSAAREWLDDCRDNDHDSRRARYCMVRELGWRAAGRPISVEPGENGGVRVMGWDRDSVHVVAGIQAWARSESAAQELAEGVEIETTPTLGADGPDTYRRDGWSAMFMVWVPRRSDLDLTTHNGPASVEGVVGRMEIETENGPLSLRNVGGDVRGRAQDGPLDIELQGDRWEGTGLDAETQNGPVHLTIPSGYSARLETGTVNGPMSIDFPVVMQGRINFRRISTDLGQGGPPIRARTTNGPLIIRRR